jgi:hypothetical protein
MRVVEIVFKEKNVYYVTEDGKIYKHQSEYDKNEVRKDIKDYHIINEWLYIFNGKITRVELTDDDILVEILNG